MNRRELLKPIVDPATHEPIEQSCGICMRCRAKRTGEALPLGPKPKHVPLPPAPGESYETLFAVAECAR
jgi:hypothetical protein